MEEESIGIGFRKGEAAFREAVAQAIEDIKADGTYAEISKKWFGVDVSR